MKIGILTYHCVCNFGAQLQTISTVGYLKRNGYDPIVIHWYPKDLDESYQKRVPGEQYKEHIHFTEQYMPLTRLCRIEEDIIHVVEENKIDAVFIGSDAVFKYIPLACRRGFSRRKLKFIDLEFFSDQEIKGNPFWGDFISKLKRKIPIAVFSVSSQNMPFNSVNKQEYDELKRLLSQFKYITVRDEWTKQMVQYFLGNIDIPVTPDPVFSFNQNTYLPVPSKQEVLHKYNLPDKYVLVSFRLKNISNDYIEKMAGIIESNGYTPVGFPMPEGMNKYKIKQNIYNPLSPLDWYYLIKYADGYIGERMHPILVALHNGVPFFCFDEYGTQKTIIPLIYRKYIPRSSKIYHILSEANLLKNMVSYNRMCRKIDPEIVVNKLFNFNREQMQQFANFYQDYYERSMVKLLEYFHTNI